MGDAHWERPAIRRIPRRDSPGERASEAADPLPWGPWKITHVLGAPVPRFDPQALARDIATRTRRNVDRLEDVPAHLVTQGPVHTLLERPKAMDRDTADLAWYPQLERAFLLHLTDACIGDNVVMDRERYYRLGRWWLGHSSELYRGIREVRHVDMAVSIGGWGGEAFQHFVLSAVPKLAMVIDLLETPEFERCKIVSHIQGAAVAQWLWRKLGLEGRVVQKPIDSNAGFVVHADLALFPQFDPNLGSYDIYARDTLLPIRRRLGLLEPVEQDLVLFLDRPGLGRFRSVGNRDELLARVQAVLRGTPHQLSIFRSSGNPDADMGVFKRAKLVFGPHGGAFANILFAQPGTPVIEFAPAYRLYAEGVKSRPTYWGLAQAAGLDYWTVEPQGFDFDSPDMRVDADEVSGLIRRLIASG